MLLILFGMCSEIATSVYIYSKNTCIFICSTKEETRQLGSYLLTNRYRFVLCPLLLICFPYSASEMFVSYGIPSFYELLRKCIFDFSERISRNPKSIIEACLSPKVYIFFFHPTMVAFSILLTINHFLIIILLLFPNTSSLFFKFSMLYFCICILNYCMYMDSSLQSKIHYYILLLFTIHLYFKLCY